MSKVKCIPIIGHVWSDWSEVVRAYNGNKQQYKYCLKCNKIVYRTIGYAGGIDADLINAVIRKLRGIDNDKV